MLADDRLTTEEWRKLRTFAKEEIDVITYSSPGRFSFESDR